MVLALKNRSRHIIRHLVDLPFQVSRYGVKQKLKTQEAYEDLLMYISDYVTYSFHYANE